MDGVDDAFGVGGAFERPVFFDRDLGDFEMVIEFGFRGALQFRQECNVLDARAFGGHVER
jgi:hypothetical protein